MLRNGLTFGKMHFCSPRNRYENEPGSSRPFVYGATLCCTLNGRRGGQTTQRTMSKLKKKKDIIITNELNLNRSGSFKVTAKKNETPSSRGKPTFTSLSSGARTCTAFSLQSCLQPEGGAAGDKSLSSQEISPRWDLCSNAVQQRLRRRACARRSSADRSGSRWENKRANRKNASFCSQAI